MAASFLGKFLMSQDDSVFELVLSMTSVIKAQENRYWYKLAVMRILLNGKIRLFLKGLVAV